MNCNQRIAKLPTPKFDSALLFLLVGVSACALCLEFSGQNSRAATHCTLSVVSRFRSQYLSRRRGTPVLRETFSFGGYWLSPPPRASRTRG